MHKKVEAEMERDRVAKVTRTLIRLKHSLAADVEINETLPDALHEFDSAHSRGQIKKVKADLADMLGI